MSVSFVLFMVAAVITAFLFFIMMAIGHAEEERKKLAREEHRRTQDREWQEQLRRYPWLGDIISHAIYQNSPHELGQIRRNRSAHRTVEKVEWKRQGF